MFFLCLGDFGSGNKTQYKVAETMAYLCAEYPVQFVIGLGDNIYPEGVRSVKSKMFQEQFEKPYSCLPKHIEFFHCLGNHDYKGNVNSQIRYTYHSKRWNLPDLYYKMRKKVNNIIVDFFAINTNMEDLTYTQRQKQEIWIVEELKKSKARWKIVFGHHPWKSSGTHGNTKNKYLNELFKKMIQTKEVHLILAGHDHDQQHIRIPNMPDLCISGAGSVTRHQPAFIRKYNHPHLLYYSEIPGCCMVGVNQNYLDVSFFNMYDKPEYNMKIFHKK